MEVYQPLLPGAIQRFAGSQKLIQTVNHQLSQQMTPGSMVEPYGAIWSHDLRLVLVSGKELAGELVD